MATDIQGVIEAVSVKERDTKYGRKNSTSFKIGDDWYSGGFKKWSVSKGDEVIITYDPSGAFKNVTKLVTVAKGPESTGMPTSPTTPRGTAFVGKTFPIDPLAPERAINRQNALTNAVNYTHNQPDASEYTPNEIIEIARAFEAYTTGDLDRDEAIAMVEAASKE